MYLYVLDDNFRAADVIEDFVSLVWTERYNSPGEISLVVPSSAKMQALVTEGIFVSIPESREAILIDTVSDQDGKIEATGKTILDFFRFRILRNTWNDDDTAWNLTGSAGVIAGNIVKGMCIDGFTMDGTTVLPNGPREIIDKLKLGPLATGTSINVAVPYGNVYDGIKSTIDLDALGVSLYPNLLTSDYELVFTTYRGDDRTTSQSTNPPVIFEPALDSFTNIRELRSNAGYVTTAFVWPSNIVTQSQIAEVDVPGGTALRNFDRRSLMVEASDIDATDTDTYPSNATLLAALTQKGQDALVNNNYVRLTDGTLVPQNAFVYGIDYFLGDVIELRGKSDIAQKARIAEYIRTQDSTGETAYPTLATIPS